MKMNILKWFRQNSPWEYGMCKGVPARRHREKGNVQFILWKAGEHGHATDYWHDFDPSWWSLFQKG
jgi:hypothetical protein